MLTPPQHSPAKTAEYIAPIDPAWDRTRIDEEMGALPDKLKKHHPFQQWLLGATLYDLDAPIPIHGKLLARKKGEPYAGSVTARDYFTGEEPTIFEIRPLSVTPRRHVYAMVNAEDTRWLSEAAARGLVTIRNAGGLEIVRGRDGLVNEETLDAIDRLGGGVLTNVAQAILFLTQRRGDAAKKP